MKSNQYRKELNFCTFAPSLAHPLPVGLFDMEADTLNITIDSQIHIKLSDIPIPLLRQVQHDLTFDSPKYQSALRMGRSTFGLDDCIHAYTIADGVIHLPRGYAHGLLKRVADANVEPSIIDNRHALPSIEFDSRIELRPYQSPAVDALLLAEQGGIVSPCGSGKTTMGLAAIAAAQQPTLWICHTRELMTQTIERAEQFLGLSRKEIGVLGNGKWKVGEKLTIGLVQTLSRRDLSEVVDKFGCIVIDESHHVPASTFSDVINQFPARFRWWLSATPTRSDGLTGLLFAVGGNAVYQIDRSQLPTITPHLVVVDTEYDRQYESYTTQISHLTEDTKRNQLIVSTIAENARGHFSLVLSDRIDHLKRLRQLLLKKIPKARIEILHGGLKKSEREAIMAAVRARDVDILLASSIAREGLDLPHLDMLYLCTPKRAAGTLEQEIGRIQRPSDGKHSAVVFDFRDGQNPMLNWQFKERSKVYTRLGMQLA